MAEAVEIRESHSDLQTSKCNSLEDYLERFSCDPTFKEIELKTETYDYEIVSSEPIGRLMFYKYCSALNPNWIRFFNLLDSLHCSHYEMIENREKIQATLSELYLDLNNEKEFKKPRKLMKKLIKELKKNFDVKKIHDFYADAHEYLELFLYQDFIKSDFFKGYLKVKSLERGTASEKGFINLKVLSSGAFGIVYLCESVLTKTKFACKCYSKSVIAKKKYERKIKMEKKILKKLNSPFVLYLICTFETERSICMVTNLMCGGDLSFHIRQLTKCKGLGFQRAQFYAAEIISGLLYLHSKRIVHFDLKPMNILLDERGHVRIGDFGLARILKKEKKLTPFGTRNYIAPEMLIRDFVSSAVDWFSFGCILYEMIEGKNPFVCLRETYPEKSWQFLTLCYEPDYSKKFNRDSKLLCEQLLEKRPKDRMLLCGYGSWSERITNDPFFDGLDWEKLESKTLDVPFVPKETENYHDELLNLSICTTDSSWRHGCAYSLFRPKIGTGVESVHWQNDLINSGFCSKMKFNV